MDDLLIVLTCVAPLVFYMIVTRGRGTQKSKYACIGLALAFLFFAAGHFAVTDELVQMLPPWVPLRAPIIYVTGIVELVIAISLFSTRWRRPGGIAAVIVLILFFPANVYAALNYTGFGEHQLGPGYLLIRAPLQLFLLAWAAWPVIWPDSTRTKRLVAHES
jgi:uncharacterized membrane protein